MRRKIMLIGPTGCGKTSLANRLNQADRPLRKTQDMIFGHHTIDVPGSYLETPWMYRHLISTAQNHAGVILILAAPDKSQTACPPEFAQVFTCPVAGVVTKADLDQSDIQAAENRLARMGVAPPFFAVSARTGAGMAPLTTFLTEQGGLQ